MEIYVKELPKSCSSCELLKANGYASTCKLSNNYADNLFKVNDDCPLDLTSKLTEPLEQRIKVLEEALMLIRMDIDIENVSVEDYIRQAEKELGVKNNG